MKIWGDGGGGHWLVRMEWCPASWSVSASVNLPCTIKSRSSLLAPALPGGPGKRAVNGCGVVLVLLPFPTTSSPCHFSSLLSVSFLPLPFPSLPTLPLQF